MDIVMPFYEYQGLDKSGKAQNGFLEAENPKAAKLILFEKAITVVRLQAVEKKSRMRRPSLSQLVIIVRQWALLLKIGFTLDDALVSVAQSCSKNSVRKALFLSAHRLQEGHSLEEVFKGSGILDELSLRILVVAEKSGKLTQVLEFLATYYEEKIGFRNRWIEAMIYPAILLVTSLGVMVLVFQWVFPSFIQLFQETHRPLPKITRMILSMGHVFSNHGVLGSIVGIAGGFGIYHLYRKRKTSWTKWISNVRGLGPLFKKKNACQVTRQLGILLASGFSLSESLALAGKGEPLVEEELSRLKIYLEEGESWDKEENQSIAFPPDFLKMLSFGFRSGELIEACLRISKYYEEDLKVLLTRCTTLAGPLFLLLVGCLIAFLVIGVVLPIFSWTV
ncbi:MAG: type II secretion system F family protein [Chlamydiae bacterium]|nr:type II secretion system F family protein [Chlamydiota bacterium]MBI3266733.1 type II secretion system F family protein [Chlamydiota bacterium]